MVCCDCSFKCCSVMFCVFFKCSVTGVVCVFTECSSLNGVLCVFFQECSSVNDVLCVFTEFSFFVLLIKCSVNGVL